MATTAYDRYLKNKKNEDSLEAVDIQVQEPKPTINYKWWQHTVDFS